MIFPLFDDNPHRRTPWFTLLIILINVLAWLPLVPLNEIQRFDFYIHWGFIPARIAQLDNPQLVVEVLRPEGMLRQAEGKPIQPGDIERLPADAGHIYLTLFTMMFLHGSWMHLIGNMWFLWIFGNNIEDRLGHLLFVIFYLAGGLLASGFHWYGASDSTVPAVGASGAVAAVLGAYAITYPSAKVRCFVFLIVFVTLADIPALLFLGFWFFGQLYLAWMQDPLDPAGVAFWAHVGGFVAGMVLMPLLSLGSSPPGADWKTEADEQFRFN